MNLTEGLRVIDITNNYAGPGAAGMLADYGAEVIHIEKPVLGDDSRHFPPIVDGASYPFSKTNHSKKSVVLDLKDPRAKELMLRMIADSDILIESNRPGVMARLGLDYESVKQYNPGLIYCSVSAFGQTGPYAKRPGYDVIAQAYSTMMYKTGDPDGPPVKSGSVIGDAVGTLNAFASIMCALYHRSRTGEGQFVDVSLARGLMNTSADFDYLLTGEVGQRQGNFDRVLCPYGVFEGNNGESIIIGAINAGTWLNLCRAMDNEALATHPDFASNDLRVANKPRVIQIVTDWIKSYPSIYEVEKRLLEFGVPCGMIYNDEMLYNDPHARENGWIYEMPVPEGVTSVDTFAIVAGPMNLSKCRPEFRRPPTLGQHNVEILSRYGLSGEEIEAMEQEWADKVTRRG